MDKLLLSRVIVIALLCLVGGMSVAKESRSETSSRIPDTDQLSVPIMVTQIITIKGPAKLSHVHGVCYLVRDETGSERPRQGAPLRNGDLLDLGDDCSVRIHSSGKPDIVLRRENGRFVKIEIKP